MILSGSASQTNDGTVGYDYRQITGDFGEGAVLGPFKGYVDAIGAGLVCTTLVGSRAPSRSATCYFYTRARAHAS
jgi:hypothetical protein